MIYFWFFTLSFVIIGGTNGCNKNPSGQGSGISYATQQYAQQIHQCNGMLVVQSDGSFPAPHVQVIEGIPYEFWGPAGAGLNLNNLFH
jgi:hypothetical protein